MKNTILFIIYVAILFATLSLAYHTMKEESQTSKVNEQLKTEIKHLKDQHIKDSINFEKCIDDKMYWINHR